MHTPDTSERRGAIKATASAGAVKAFRTARPEKPQPLTLAIRPWPYGTNPGGVRRSPAGASAAALAEWGSTTGQQRWPGAEGGHRPALFSGYGHGAAAEKVNQQDAGYDARDEENSENES